MTIKQIRVISSGSLDNVGFCFSDLAVADDSVGDIILLKQAEDPEVRSSTCGVGADSMPLYPGKNRSGAIVIIDECSPDQGFIPKIRKALPIGACMRLYGASAAVKAAALPHSVLQG